MKESSIAPFVWYYYYNIILSYVRYHIMDWNVSSLWVSEAGVPKHSWNYWCYLVLYFQIHLLSKKLLLWVGSSTAFSALPSNSLVEVYKHVLGCAISMGILNLIYHNLPILVASWDIFPISCCGRTTVPRRRPSQHQSQGEMNVSGHRLGKAMNDEWKNNTPMFGPKAILWNLWTP